MSIRIHKIAGTLISATLLANLSGCFCGQFFRQGDDVVSLAIMPLNTTVVPGTSQQFSATGVSGTGTIIDVTQQVMWTSSDPSIATVSSGGLATGLASGTAFISGSCQCYGSQTKLTVTPQDVKLLSIAVTPTSPIIAAGSVQQFVTTATYSNNTSSAITSALWSSSNSAIATISAAGLATGLTSGVVTITAISGTISGSTELDVQ